MSVRIRFWVLLFLSGLALHPSSNGQPHGYLSGQLLATTRQTSQQQWADYMARRQTLQAQAKQIVDAETAREKAPECPSATTTYDFNLCYSRQTRIADAGLRSLEGIIRELLAPPPEKPGPVFPAASGVAGPTLTPEQLIAEFNRVEQTWDQYREAACSAAVHQFHGGPGVQGECQVRLARDHLRELDLIYGAALHL
jgi:hypothetical protein